MSEWWNSLPMLQQVFYILAIPSTIILILQTVLLLFGLGGGHDIDHAVDHDFDHDFSHDFHQDMGQASDQNGSLEADHETPHGQETADVSGLRLLTVRGIIAFLSIAGWVGVAAIDMGAGGLPATILAVIAGFGAMVLVAVIMRASLKLQQSGNLDYRNALGLTGEVYVPIPEGGKGKVTLVMQERYLEADAICTSRALKTGEPVKVIAITESNTLVVAPLS